MKKITVMVGMAVACFCNITAQTTNKNLLGAWFMESMQYEGEEEIIGKAQGYTQFKYYGADGEYACAAIVLQTDGEVAILPHEYGTYTYNDGVYSEMGRKAIKDAIVFIDKETLKGYYFNRIDIWKKSKMPKEVVDEILNYCKIVKLGLSAKSQKLINEHMFGQ